MLDYLILIGIVVNVVLQIQTRKGVYFFKKLYRYFSNNNDKLPDVISRLRPDPNDPSGCPDEEELK